MGKSDIHVWLGKELKEACKKLNINISREFRLWLAQRLKENNIEVKVPEPEIVLLVGCIHCGHQFETTSISQVRCPNCQKTFRVYVRGGTSRIKKIIRGDIQKLYALYAKKFKKSLI